MTKHSHLHTLKIFEAKMRAPLCFASLWQPLGNNAASEIRFNCILPPQIVYSYFVSRSLFLRELASNDTPHACTLFAVLATLISGILTAWQLSA